MEAGFKPFFVDLAENDAMAQSVVVTPGRYIVISVIGGVSHITGYSVASLLAYRVAEGESKRLCILNSTTVTFVGFVGDCLMCDRRKPVEAP